MRAARRRSSRCRRRSVLCIVDNVATCSDSTSMLSQSKAALFGATSLRSSDHYPLFLLELTFFGYGAWWNLITCGLDLTKEKERRSGQSIDVIIFEISIATKRRTLRSPCVFSTFFVFSAILPASGIMMNSAGIVI